MLSRAGMFLRRPLSTSVAPAARLSSGRTGRALTVALLLSVALDARAEEPGRGARAGPPTRCYAAGQDLVACYDQPSVFGFLLNVPGDIGSFLVDGFRRDNLPALAGIAAATAGLVAVDQSLVNGAQRAGRATHVASADETRKVPGLSLPYPADVGAALYYIGDGMVPATIALGLFAYGLGASDVRALQTTSQLIEGTLSVGIVVQAVKHAAGRESPGQATQAGGAWRPAPNLRDYHKNVPAFDAFPSGHMATAMVTLTVLAENYPELLAHPPRRIRSHDVARATDDEQRRPLGKRLPRRDRSGVRAREARGGAWSQARPSRCPGLGPGRDRGRRRTRPHPRSDPARARRGARGQRTLLIPARGRAGLGGSVVIGERPVIT